MKPLTLNVTMVGPTGVGKTSLLAAMYEQSKMVAGQLGCTFAAEGGTKQTLNDRMVELKALAAGKKLRIANDVGIQGTTERRDYEFHLSLPKLSDSVPPIDIVFTDMPGGWFSGTGDYTSAQESLGKSHVSFWCVDATALMQGDDGNGLGEFHENINEPSSVYDCYQQCIDSFPDHHRIHFVLMRAETYLHKQGKENLFARWRQAYKEIGQNIIRLAKARGKTVTITCSCVQTVGNVYFHRWLDESSGKPKAEFTRVANKGYSPDGCKSPIATAIQCGLIESLQKMAESMRGKQSEVEEHIKRAKENDWGLFSDLYEWLGGESDRSKHKKSAARAAEEWEDLSGRCSQVEAFLSKLVKEMEDEEVIEL